MSDESPNALMHAAAEVARVAGAIANRHFRTAGLSVRSKGDGSPVTVADLESERAAREWIRQRFPADGILGEEFGGERLDAKRRWVLDPIDGTRTYVHGVPLWGTLVGVASGDEVLAGAAFFPALDELICAAPGEGCWLNGERVQVSQISRLTDSLVLTTDETFAHLPERRTAWQRLADGAGMSRSWGDCYGYLLVASGRAEVMVDPVLSEWDATALLPVVEEAGGVFTDWSGMRGARGGSAIATNAALANQARNALRDEPGRESEGP